MEPYLHSPMYLGGIYRDNFTLLACVELPYALNLADGSKMEHYVGFFYAFCKGKKKGCESGNRYCVLSVEYNEELYDMYSPSIIIRVIKSRKARWSGHVALIGERRGAYKILVGIPEARRLLGRSTCRWENNIKMNLQEVGCWAWTGLIWLRIGTGDSLL